MHARNFATATAPKDSLASKKANRDLSEPYRQLVTRLDTLGRRADPELGEDIAEILKQARELAPVVEQSRLAALSTRLSVHFFVDTSLTRFCEGALDELIHEVGARSGAVLLFSADNPEARVVAARSWDRRSFSPDEVRVSRSILAKILDGQDSVLVSDAITDEMFCQEDSVRKLSLRSVLAIPLRIGDYLAGAIHLENEVEPGAFGDAELELLRGAGQHIAIYLNAAFRLGEETQARRRLYDELKGKTHFDGLVGSAPRFLQVLDVVSQVGPSNATVFIEGENGTGKELIARALHATSRRSNRPIVVVNCAAIPLELLESELFGHERGAFTSAVDKRIGRLEQANGTTLFLDEVGELPQPLQAKLLRFLQNGEIQRLGGTHTITVDVRLLAATNRDIHTMVKRGEFREDLFYRLYVVPLKVPPLRERRSDIPLLVDHFLSVFSLQSRREVPKIDPEVYEAFQAYAWPGNVRELENLLQRLIVLSDGRRIEARALPDYMLQGTRAPLDIDRNPFRRLLDDVPLTYPELQCRRKELHEITSRYLQRLDDKFVDNILGAAGRNVSRAAKKSGMHRTVIHRNLRARGRKRED